MIYGVINSTHNVLVGFGNVGFIIRIISQESIIEGLQAEYICT